jgi:peroxiredoxin
VNDSVNNEKSYARFDEFFPQGPFNLPTVLKMFRDGRDQAVGRDIADRMDRATAELEAVNPLSAVPSPGSAAPLFELPNHKGTTVSLTGLLETGPVVVVFYRGVWCPYCNLTLRAYQQHVPEITQLGATVVAVSPQAPDDSLTVAERNDLTYEVLSDVRAAAARAYGLVFRLPRYLQEAYQEMGHPLPAFNGTDDWELPIPATFVIDRDGTIRFADADPDYTRRANPAVVLAALREIT